MDYRGPLATVLIIGGAVGLLMPRGDGMGDGYFSDDASDAGLAQPDFTAPSDSGDAPVTWAEEVAFERERDGHFYADVVVDGVSSRMLVDTGASVIALTGEDAMAMGLHWDENDVMPVAQGANGAVHGVHTQLRHVRVGSFEANDVRAMIIPEGLGISLLGQSFLSTIDQVQIADDRMMLAN